MGKIPRFSNGMSWILDMMSLFQGTTVNVPGDYRSQVLGVKKLMENDESGIISTLLDFGISSSSDVSFSVETNNENLSKIFNGWLNDVNSSLLGKIPIGIENLAKEYYRERWKGSSFLLLRTVWETVDGMRLPTKMWFVDGEDIDVASNSRAVTLGDEKYGLIVDYQNRKIKALPSNKNEKIFIQKPYTSWGVNYPTPFIIQRGLYKNALFLKNLINKGEVVVAKALEYLMVVKKGTEALAKENRSEFIYSDDDLKAVKEQFGLLLDQRGSNPGTPSYITNFDTDIEHLIPEYDRILKPTLFAPIEKRILSGLGMVDLADSSTSKREGILNPKPFIGELNSGINDFGDLLKDILLSIIIENKGSHPKYFSSKNSVNVSHTPVKAFMTDDYKTMLRSLYDRGVLSKKSFVEVVGETDFTQERDRRKAEATEDDKTFYPPVIQNMEQYADDNKDNNEDPKKVEETTPDKVGPEAKNYNNSEVADSPYTKVKDLPNEVKDVMSTTLQKVWMEVCNAAYPDGIEYASSVAWDAIKQIATKNKSGKWIKKTQSQLTNSFEEASVEELVQLKNLSILGKKEKLLDAFLQQNK